MKQALKKNVRTVVRLEDTRASTGSFVGGDVTVEKRIHEAQVKGWDTRRALALSAVHQSEAPLSYVRSLLQRGNLESARTALESLIEDEKNNSLERSQILFEKARLAFFESDWAGVIDSVGQSLSAGAPPVTQLALFQLRANAYFEMGQFQKASSDVEEAEQLGTLFPHAVSLLYVRTLKARIFGRDRGVRPALVFLEQLLRERMDQNKVDLDLLLTFLRVQIDLKRLALLPSVPESIACFMISDAIGDKLYCGLAELDYYVNFSASSRELRSLSASLKGRFLRVDHLLNEIDAIGSTSSVTGLSIHGALGKLDAGPMENAHGPQEDSFKQTVLILKKFGIVSDLEKSKVHCYAPDHQILQALLAISEGPLSKKEFFARLWGRQLYSPRLHDGLISSLVHRIKKETSIRIHVRDGQIEAQKSFLVI